MIQILSWQLPPHRFSGASGLVWNCSKGDLSPAQDFANLLACVACLLLNALGLGKVVKTVAAAGGGRPNCFFCKRPVVESMQPCLAELGFSDDSVPSLATYQASVTASLAAPPPPRSPSIAWEPFAEARDTAAPVHFLNAMS